MKSNSHNNLLWLRKWFSNTFYFRQSLRTNKATTWPRGRSTNLTLYSTKYQLQGYADFLNNLPNAKYTRTEIKCSFIFIKWVIKAFKIWGRKAKEGEGKHSSHSLHSSPFLFSLSSLPLSPFPRPSLFSPLLRFPMQIFNVPNIISTTCSVACKKNPTC